MVTKSRNKKYGKATKVFIFIHLFDKGNETFMPAILNLDGVPVEEVIEVMTKCKECLVGYGAVIQHYVLEYITAKFTLRVETPVAQGVVDQCKEDLSKILHESSIPFELL